MSENVLENVDVCPKCNVNMKGQDMVYCQPCSNLWHGYRMIKQREVKDVKHVLVE